MRLRCPWVLMLAVLLAPFLKAPPTRAAGNDFGKIMLHSLSVMSKNACSRPENLPTQCSGFDAGSTMPQPLSPATRYLYLLAVNGSVTEGIAGLQCGIARTTGNSDGVGLDMFGWTLCATLEFTWPNAPWGAPGSGNLITWDSVNRCQTSGTGNYGAVAVAGFWYCGAYSSECIQITPHPADGWAKLANCAAVEDNIYYDGVHLLPGEPWFLGRVCFGQNFGWNPCGLFPPDPVTPATWSQVKTLIE